MSGCVFLGWFTAAKGGELVSSETVVTADVTWYAQWKAQESDVPTYGPWGDGDDVGNPDKLGPTCLQDMPLTINGVAGAKGDVVAVYRTDTDTVCGLGKVLDDSGALTLMCYAPTGTKLHFKVWIASSGIDEPTILDCDKKCDLTAPTTGSFHTGHTLVVSGEKELTLSLKKADWHTVSFNVVPDDDPSPAAMFADVADQIEAVTQGVNYWMPGKAGTLNTIEIGKGYWVKTKSEDVSWTVSGKPNPSVEIPLTTGWNLIGYAPEDEESVASVLKTAFDAKAIDYVTYGISFYPNGTLTQMLPGAAYWVHATKDYTLVYDEVAKLKMVMAGPMLAAAGVTTPTYGPFGENEDVANPDKLGPTIFTDVALTIDGELAAVGDCVAAYRGDTGALCGLGKVLETPGSLTVVCYAPKGTELTFKTWKSASGVSDPLILECGNTTAPTAGEIVGTKLVLSAVSKKDSSLTTSVKFSLDTGLIGYVAKNLPRGLKYNAKTGIISGMPTVATSGKVVVTLTKRGAQSETLEFEVAAAPESATGTFTGFVQTEDGTLNAGTLQVIVSAAGKISAKAVLATGSYVFSTTGWDSVDGNVYSATLTTRKGDELKISCDAGAGWNEDQLTGTFKVSGGTELPVAAQKNAFGKQWFFNAEGDQANGWKLSFAESSKGAALTVSMSATGATVLSGKLGGYAVKATGVANMLGIVTGAINADFAPIIRVGKVKKALSVRINLWFDKQNDHSEGVGRAVIVE